MREQQLTGITWTLGAASGEQLTGSTLKISLRTVHKHLERAYRKLGVTDRSQAAATVWAAVGVETALGQGCLRRPCGRLRRVPSGRSA